MSRLVRVELRKATDTRSGRWLLTSIVGMAAVGMVVMAIVGLVQDRAYSLRDFVQLANLLPMGFLLPVIGILTVTTEWSQRTNVVTFTLEPRRSRIVFAKLANGVILSVAASGAAFTTGIAALGAFDLAGGDATWDLSAGMLGSFGMFHLINVLTGFAFGMLILNTPAAIVSFFAYSFVLPGLFMFASGLWSWAEKVQPWVDFNFAQEPLTEGTFTGMSWAQFAVTAAVWFVIPVALGVRRLLRAEIK